MANRSSSAFPGTTPHTHTHTHTIFMHILLHTHLKENYITHQLFLFPSPNEISPVSIEARGESPGTSTGSGRKGRFSLRLRTQALEWPEASFQQGELPKMLIPSASSLEPQTPHMPHPHPNIHKARFLVRKPNQALKCTWAHIPQIFCVHKRRGNTRVWVLGSGFKCPRGKTWCKHI